MPNWTRSPAGIVAAGALLLAAAATAGCRQQMADQPSYRPLEQSAFFADGSSARHLAAHSVSRSAVVDGEAVLHSGKVDNGFARELPLPVTRELLRRGRERYDIFCSPCHDRVGNGQGMIVRRGFSRAATFHSERLRAVEPGYLFDVITRGFGAMPSYRAQVPVPDRWAIVAYIRALQLSQNATLADVPESDRTTLR